MLAWLKRHAIALLTGLGALIGAVFLIASKLTARPASGKLVTEALEARHAPKIAALRERYEQVRTDIDSSEAEVKSALSAVHDAYAVLHTEANERTTMTGEEVVAMFRRIEKRPARGSKQ